MASQNTTASVDQKVSIFRTNKLLVSIRKNYMLYGLLVLPLIYLVIFKYIPMAGNLLAFRKFVPGGFYLGEKWVGFFYFEQFIFDSGFWNVFFNTIKLSFFSLIITFPLPICFALLLNELTQMRFKKIVQTITIIPNFLSIVVVVSMLTTLLSPSIGIINKIIESLGGESIYFMNEPGWFRTIYIASNVWQHMGWSSIIYMAILAGADQSQYEAAMVDGANRIQQVWYVTIPLMLPTISINFIIALGNILNVGFEKVLLMYNPTTMVTADVIQTYVYRMGLQSGNYSYGTAVGLFQSVIGLTLLFTANFITNRYFDSGLW